MTHDLGWWFVGNPMVNFLFTLIELLRYLLRFQRYRWNVYSSAVFTGVDLFALKSYLDRVIPINHCWRQKTWDTGLPDGEDGILLHSSFSHNTVVWPTDGRTDRRTNERSLFANEQKGWQWQATSRGRSPSKLAAKKRPVKYITWGDSRGRECLLFSKVGGWETAINKYLHKICIPNYRYVRFLIKNHRSGKMLHIFRFRDFWLKTEHIVMKMLGKFVL